MRNVEFAKYHVPQNVYLVYSTICPIAIPHWPIGSYNNGYIAHFFNAHAQKAMFPFPV